MEDKLKKKKEKPESVEEEKILSAQFFLVHSFQSWQSFFHDGVMSLDDMALRMLRNMNQYTVKHAPSALKRVIVKCV